MVLIGSEKACSADADVSEFGTPAQMAHPLLIDVLARIGSCTKPVVAAISGVALGGGLELAARVTLESASLGLPEIMLGLIPGAGGTQRLPRLVGIATAWSMVLSGSPQPAKQLASTGLLDLVVADNLLGAATALASNLAASHVTGTPLPHARDRTLDAVACKAFMEEQRSKLNARQRMQPAYCGLTNALTAACGKFDDRMRCERSLFFA